MGVRGRIFGIGLSRTASTSLNAALEQLGFTAAHFPADARTRAEVMGSLAGDTRRLRLSILARLDGITDSPAAATFADLDRGYPGSRFILTLRERESWLTSCRAYWRDGVEPFIRQHPDDPWTTYVVALSQRLYGSAEFDANRFASAYDHHSAAVRARFRNRPGQLLELDVCGGQGWPELCGFLGRPVECGPFPWRYRALR